MKNNFNLKSNTATVLENEFTVVFQRVLDTDTHTRDILFQYISKSSVFFIEFPRCDDDN